MSCPFKHLWATTPEDGSADVSLATEPNKGSVRPRTCSQTEPEPLNNHINQGLAGSVPREGPVCPLGFGASRGPALSALHCPLCRSLYHDPVLSQPCGHRFCRYCIQKFGDCPLCGADLDTRAMTTDEETQRAVYNFLDVHAADLGNMQSPGQHSNDSNIDTDEKKRTVNNLLHIGLSSLVGGNPAGGAAFLSRCRSLLEDEARNLTVISDEPSYENMKIDIALKLGAVLDCLGDCYRTMGDAVLALEHYDKAALQLQYALENQKSKSKEDTLHALSVILNKQGEVLHQQGDIVAALGLYRRALDARRQRRKAVDDITSCPEAGFDVVVSELKVADAYRSLGNKDDALQHAACARSLLTEVENHLPLTLSSKKQMVKGYLDSFITE